MIYLLVSSYFSVISVALLFLALCVAFRLQTTHIPGPWHAKWTGAAATYHWLNGTSPFYIDSLHEQYGPVICFAPNEVSISDVEDVKAVYTTKETFRKSPWYRLLTANLHNVFNTDNIDLHRRHRRLLASTMSESSLKSLIPDIASRVDIAVKKMKEEMHHRGAADVYKWWFFMATDTIGELSFGDSFRMLEVGRITQYAEDLQKIAVGTSIRVAFPWVIKILGHVPLPQVNTVKRRAQRLASYAIESLRRYENTLMSDPTRVRRTLFSNIFQAGKEDKMTFDEIRVSAQTFIVAGSNTTADTLTYLVWAVCRRPAVRERLVRELHTLPEGYSESHLRALPYLQGVINETLRLFAIIPARLPRVVPPEGANIGGYWLGGGTIVGTQAYTMHRKAGIFPDPETFDPTRWETPTKAMKDAFMPFGRGSRNCIGMHLALIEIRLAVASFFLNFPNAKVSALEGMSEQDMTPKVHFLLTPTGGRCLIQPA